MNIKEKYQEIVVESGMNLYQLNEICIESSKEVLSGDCKTSDVSVFFCGEKKIFDKVNIQLRHSSELNTYILVFSLK